MNQERGGGGCNSGIYGTTGEEEEEGHLQGKVLPLWGVGSLCQPDVPGRRIREAFDSKAAPTKVEKEVDTDDNCAMSAHAPLEKRWGDIELLSGGLQKMRGRILEVPKLLDHIWLREPRMTVAG